MKKELCTNCGHELETKNGFCKKCWKWIETNRAYGIHGEFCLCNTCIERGE